MDYRRTYIKDLFETAPGTEASAYGWVKTRRDSKEVSFVQLNDIDDLRLDLVKLSVARLFLIHEHRDRKSFLDRRFIANVIRVF